jgi:hypothetical protein
MNFMLSRSASLFAEVHRNTSEATCNSLHSTVARHANCCHQPRLNLAQLRDWIADITSRWCTTDTGQLYSDHVSHLQPLAFHGTWWDRGTFGSSCAYFFEIIEKVNNLSGAVCSRITPPVTLSTSYESYQLNTVRAHFNIILPIHLYVPRYSSCQLPEKSSLM